MANTIEYEEQIQTLQVIHKDDPAQLSAQLEDVLDKIIHDTQHTEELASVFETIIETLLSAYIALSNGEKFNQLLNHLQQYFLIISKARVAKCVRLIIQGLRKVKGTRELQIFLCRKWIEWATKEERTMLRQRLETELSEILLEERQFQEALGILSRLSSELRKVDHKSQLIEVHLIESRTYRGLGDISHAKSSLTAARTNAAAVYTPPILQGQLDLESGIINTDDGDYRIAVSYFTEAFDAFFSASDPRAYDALKYKLLCKILDGKPSECEQIAAAAAMQLTAQGQADPMTSLQITTMIEIAKAAENKSLQELSEVMERRRVQLEADSVVQSNVRNLVENLEEQHLLRIIKPYSAVELSRIAAMIHLPVEEVVDKLVQMILDQKLKASINQRDGILNIFETEEENTVISQSIELIEKMDGVVDALYTRCKLMA